MRSMIMILTVLFLALVWNVQPAKSRFHTQRYPKTTTVASIKSGERSDCTANYHPIRGGVFTHANYVAANRQWYACMRRAYPSFHRRSPL
jgi:hypothetical protein